MFLMLKEALVDCSTGNWAKALQSRRILGTGGFEGGLRGPKKGLRCLPRKEALQSTNRRLWSVRTLAGLGASWQAGFSPISLMLGDGCRVAPEVRGVSGKQQYGYRQ